MFVSSGFLIVTRNKIFAVKATPPKGGANSPEFDLDNENSCAGVCVTSQKKSKSTWQKGSDYL